MVDEKKSIFDMVGPDVLEEADRFIEDLKAGKIRRVVDSSLKYSRVGEFDDAEALEKFREISSNPEIEQVIVNAYNRGEMDYD